MIEVVEPGVMTTFQDLGRPGWGSLGVPVSGALDRTSHRRANALVGNTPDAATLEVTGGGLVLRALDRHVVALAGAACGDLAMDVPIVCERDQILRFAAPRSGLRTYVAVAGGFVVDAVLGSCSHDQLCGLGPPPLARGDVLVVGDATAPEAAVAGAGTVPPRTAPEIVRVWSGPRADMVRDGLVHLCSHAWQVTDDISRVGVRLEGSPFVRTGSAELASEGLVTGAIQIPHDGQPIVMLADHPTTGGYPVVAVVDPGDIDTLAHLRPGDRLRFVVAPDPAAGEPVG
jgi:biotin-dependent carboxylase-like uncharacterized protein